MTELELDGVALPLDMTTQTTLLSGGEGRPDAGAPAPFSDSETHPSVLGAGSNGPAPSGPVLSLAELARCHRTINDHEAAIHRLTADYEEQQREIADWKTGELRLHERAIQVEMARMASGTQVEIDRNPLKRKSVKLPTGLAGFKTPQVRVTIADKAAFIAWAKDERPDWLRIQPEPDLTAINENTFRRAADGSVVTPGREAGESIVVPGVRLVGGAEVFWVQTGAGGRRYATQTEEAE